MRKHIVEMRRQQRQWQRVYARRGAQCATPGAPQHGALRRDAQRAAAAAAPSFWRDAFFQRMFARQFAILRFFAGSREVIILSPIFAMREPLRSVSDAWRGALMRAQREMAALARPRSLQCAMRHFYVPELLPMLSARYTCALCVALCYASIFASECSICKSA